jgi:ribonuclease VapC
VIVDSSALLAVLFGEDDADRFARALAAARDRRMSAINWFEAAINADRHGDPSVLGLFDDLCQRIGVTIEPVTAEHARLARSAHAAFGKGRHRAGLNLGDCFAYALAKATGEPLLFKGDDFTATDVTRAL